jgi:hypothetical protein
VSIKRGYRLRRRSLHRNFAKHETGEFVCRMQRVLSRRLIM